MNKYSYKIVAALIALSFSLATAQTAIAEDASTYGNAQYATPVGSADAQYAVPSAYDGQYYPQEEQSATGYYGTEQTSDNSNHISDPDAYNLYYY